MPMHVTRRRFTAASAAALASAATIRGSAKAAEFALKFGTTEPQGTPLTIRALAAFERIRKESNGRVDIQLFPGNTLGGLSSMLAQMRAGALAFVPVDGITLSGIVPVAAILGIGFAFRDNAHGFAAFDGDLGAYVRKEIFAKGLYAHERMLSIGMRDVSSNPHPVLGPDDLHGLKLRTLPGRLSVDLFKSLGASTVAMDSSEVYPSLQTHLIDGEETGLILFQINRIYEVQKYCSLTDHQWGAFWLCGNLDIWNSLPPDLQAIVSRNFSSYSNQQRSDVEVLTKGTPDVLRSHGMNVSRPDRAPFRAHLGPFYQRWRAEFGETAWTLLEKYAGKLA